MPFSVNREFLGYLLILAAGFLDAFLIAHPSLIIRTGYHFPELSFLTHLSSTVLLVLFILSFFYVITGTIMHSAAVKKHLLPRAFIKIKVFLILSILLVGTAFVAFNFTKYSLLDWPFRTGIYMLFIIMLLIFSFRLKTLYRISKWHSDMEK